MAEEKKKQEEPNLEISGEGLEVQISVAGREGLPKFNPLIKRISEVVSEVTQTRCSQVVAAKMRW